MTSSKFTGDKKAPMRSPLAKLERRFIDAWVPRFPKAIEGYHLTLMTIVWTAGLILFGYIARFNIHWLHGASLMLFLQWFTDSFDGSLGRYRDTGIPKWGFYMDHMLDFIFMPTVFIAYTFILSSPRSICIMLIIGFIYAILMVNSFLAFGATGEFKITYLGTGPTETRLYLIILNTCIIAFGTAWLEKSLPYALIVFFVVLVIIIWQTQRGIWAADMKAKSDH